MIHLLRTRARPKGHVIITEEFGTIEYETTCCVHCRVHWQIKPGSEKDRGFCTNCMGPTCGSKACDKCVPYMKMIEEIEKETKFNKV